jgi:hypothetical protein
VQVRLLLLQLVLLVFLLLPWGCLTQKVCVKHVLLESRLSLFGPLWHWLPAVMLLLLLLLLHCQQGLLFWMLLHQQGRTVPMSVLGPQAAAV